MLPKRGNFLMGQIGNVDETPIWLDMPHNYTVEQKGAKQVPRFEHQTVKSNVLTFYSLLVT